MFTLRGERKITDEDYKDWGVDWGVMIWVQTFKKTHTHKKEVVKTATKTGQQSRL